MPSELKQVIIRVTDAQYDAIQAARAALQQQTGADKPPSIAEVFRHLAEVCLTDALGISWPNGDDVVWGKRGGE